MNVMLRLPPHKPTAKREKQRVDGSPGNQYAEIQSDSRV
jgi:hypothetical protein